MRLRPIVLAIALVSLGVLPLQPVSAGPPRYRIIDLTERAPVVQSEARAITPDGVVVGFELLPEYQAQAIFWDTNQDGQLLTRLEGDNSNFAYGINAGGLVTGTSELVTIEHIGHQKRIHRDSKASIWLNGAITKLADLVREGDDLELQWANAANERGVIIGVGKVSGDDFYHGFIFDDGLLTEMTGFPEGARGVQPHALNETGSVVGEFFNGGGNHAFLWEDGVGTDLHDRSVLGGVTSRAYKINNSGQIVGEAQFLISHPESPVLWENGVPVNLVGHLFSRPQGIATSINKAGQIVGFVADLDVVNSPFEGFLIENGNYLPLKDLIPPEGWDILYAFDINDAGWIVGGGVRNGQLGHAWLMIPNDAEGN
jgi:probable HAF family extracellular repeat protein